MKDRDKTKQQLIDELGQMRQQIALLQTLETERKQTEELRNSKELIETVFESVHDSISVIDTTSFRIVGVNRAFLNTLNMEENEVIGKHCYEVTHRRTKPCEPPNDTCPLAETLRTGCHSSAEHVHYDKHGREIYVEVSTSPIRNGKGEIHQVVHITRDITERKRAEERIRKGHEFTLSLVKGLSEGFAVVDQEGRQTLVNTELCKMTGYSEKELLEQKPPFKYWAEEGLEEINEVFEKTLKGIEGEYELVFKKKSGERFIALVSPRKTADPDGNTVFFATVKDITERKRAEEELRESEERYRALINLGSEVGEAVLMLGDTEETEGVQTFVSDQWLRITGYSRKELLGMPFFNLLHPRYRQASLDRHQRKIRGEVIPGLYEMSIIRKDGTEVPIELTSAHTMYQGKPANVGYIRDITERKQAEEELKIRAQLLDAVTDSILVHDFDGNFIYLNEAACKMRGYSKDELLRMKLHDLLAPEDAKLVPSRIKHVIEKGEATFEATVLRKDGSILSLELHTRTIQWGDKRLILSVARDITRRKQAEKQIKASLEEKELLLKEIHHRVKNNMQIISSLLKLQSGGVKDKKTRELFNESQNRIKSMALVYNKLYQSQDLAKIGLKEYIEELTHNLVQSYRGASGRITTRMEISNVLLGVDLAIPCGLVINELLTNSLKYAFPGDRSGEIRVSLQETDGNKVEITISDNGVGIPDNLDLAKTKTLGLHLVSSLVEQQLGGKIELNRTAGTEFRITFKKNQTQGAQVNGKHKNTGC
jgi:PAS domain S-box-containing protein